MTKEEMIEIYMNFSKYVLGEIPFPREDYLKKCAPETPENLSAGKVSVLKEYNRQNLLPKKMAGKYAEVLSTPG